MTLSPAAERFILHWGDMGPRWGVNRSVAQIHALLYLTPKPLPAEEIAETLSIARSNVSMSIKELQSWGIIRTESVLGDRRDHYRSVEDVWELFRIVLDERKRREVDPTLEVLRECVELAEKGRGRDDEIVAKRVKAMLSFFEIAAAWYANLRALPQTAIKAFLRMGTKLRGWIDRSK